MVTQVPWHEKYKALYVSPAIHKRMAVKAAEEGRQIMEVAEEACREYLDSHAAVQSTPDGRKESA